MLDTQSPPPSLQATPPGRLAVLDQLRTVTVSYVVLYHVAQVSARGGLGARPGEVHRALSAALLATGLWRMPLLFLVAGATMQLVVRRRGWRDFMVGRVQRLVVPAVFALAVVVPLMRYADSGQSAAAFAGHAWDHLTGPGGPDWYHVWFVVYLIVITAAALVLRPLAGVLRPRPRRAATLRALLAAGGVLTLLVQAVPTRVVVAASIPGLNARILAGCAVFFAVGAGLARVDGALAGVALRRRRNAGLAALFAIGVGVLAAAHDSGAALLPALTVGGRTSGLGELSLRVFGGAGAGFGALAVLGYGHRYLRRSSRGVDYLRDAAYSMYLLHQAVLAWVVRGLGGWRSSPFAEYLVLVVLTAAATLGVYECAGRRTRAGRLACGLPPRVAAPGASAGALAARAYARVSAPLARRLTAPGDAPTRRRNAWLNAASER